jgi:cation diffusion facilitator family transporter
VWSVVSSRNATQKEKQRATVVGVVAASFLTGIKLIAGILSNSLAVLAEAAHSGLDLASAALGFFAIRVSGRPADKEHHYGHGKADTIGGFFAALFLLVTCFWIIWEGINRLIRGTVELNVTLLTFTVILVSIAVDAERTVVFRRIGKKTGSPTIQGEALHFASDIASSCAVLGGLVFVSLGFFTLDAYLALVIAVYFGYTSIHLAIARTSELLDRAPSELQEQIKEIVKSVRGVEACDRVRLRKSGSKLFVDLVISVHHRTQFAASHRIASNVERAVKKVFRDSDVVVHVHPSSYGEEILDRVREVALREGASGVHGVEIEAQGRKLRVNFDLEFAHSTSFGDAHEISSKVESELQKAFPEVTIVTTHLEPEEQKLGAAEITSKTIIDRIGRIAMARKGVQNCHDIYVSKTGEELHVSMHCNFDANLSVAKVHEISTDLEEDIKRDLKEIATVTIHSEPVYVRR